MTNPFRKLFGHGDANPPQASPLPGLRSVAEESFPASAIDGVLAVLEEIDPTLPAPERHRAQLAVLKLSEGSEDQLRSYADAANKDFRDVLMWAESSKPTPEQAAANKAEVEKLLKFFG